MQNTKSQEIIKRYFEGLDYLITIGKVDNVNAYCTEMGLTRPNFYRLKREPNRKFDMDLLYDIVRRGISAHWLITGQGNIVSPFKVYSLELSDSHHQ